MPHVVIAIAVFLAQIAWQRRQNTQGGKGKQSAIGYLVETMAVGVVCTQHQTAELLGCAGLQPGVVTARIRTKFIYVAKALIERLAIGKGREASVAHRLVSVQLHLVRLMHGARAHVIQAQRAARSQFALDAETPLQESKAS